MRRGPWVDLAVLVLLLLVQRSVLGLDAGTFTSDEGAYASQAVALADDGDWAVDDPFLADGDGGARTSYVNATVDDGRVYAYAQRPLWPTVLGRAYDLGGEAALYLVPLVFAVGVPLVAWRLASLLLGGRPALARVGFWAAAVSPAVVVNGHVLWAHSASALVSGLAVLGVVEARRRGNRVPGGERSGFGNRLSREPGPLAWPVALAAGATFVAAMLRAEGLLFAGALAAALLAAAWVRRRPAGVALAAVVAVAGGAGHLVSSAWRDGITGTPDRLAARTADGSRLDGVVSGALHDLVGDAALSTRAGALALTVVAIAAVLLGVRARRGVADAVGFGAVALGALVAAWAISPDGTVTGLAAAWPLGVAGLVALRLPDGDEERLLLGTAGLFTAAVLATNYAEGGGLEWGGRFLSPLTAVAAVGAASLWSTLTARTPASASTGPTVVRWLGVAACVVIAGFATTAMRGSRDGGAMVEELVEAADAPVALATNEYLPNIAWRTRATTAWIVVGDEAPGRSLGDALAAMDEAGVDRFVTVGIRLDDLAAAGVAVERTDGPMAVARLGPAER